MSEAIKRIYGDTDSLFLKGIDPFDEKLMEFVGEWISKNMDGFCKKYNAINRFKIRPDKSFASFIQVVIPGTDKGKKKNYAGFIVKELKEKVGGSVWKDTFDFETTGFEKSDISKVGMDIFLEILKKVCLHRVRTRYPKLLEDHPEIKGGIDIEGELMDYVRKMKKKYMMMKFSLFDIATTIQITKPLDQYGKTMETIRGDKVISKRKGIPAHARAAMWSNKHLKTSFDSGDKIPWVYVRNNKGTDVIAVDEDWTYEYLEDREIRVDLNAMWNKEIVDKINSIVLTIGLNLIEVLTGMKKQSIDKWMT
jgi:DNA polymerase elongation subunit (family B)